MRDYNTLAFNILNAFETLYKLKNNKMLLCKVYHEFGMSHSHTAESTYDFRGNISEEYEYVGRSERNPSLNYGFEIHQFQHDSKNRSEIYIGMGGIINYHLNPKYLDDILVRIKIQAGEPCDEYPFREIYDECNHFMISTAIHNLPERDELLAFYEFAQKIRPMLMKHKCYISGNLPQIILPNMSHEFLELAQ